MRAFQFSKPKTPGFGISRDFYLSVLSSRPVLPPIATIVEPKGAGGAVEGFGVPLASQAAKEDLSRPMERGAYAVATKDRKTVLKLLVFSKEEAGFDPTVFTESALAQGLSDELLNRARATWTMIQMTFESHDAMVYPSLDFLLEVTYRLASLCEGVVADPVGQRYLLPSELRHLPPSNPKIDVRDHVNVRAKSKPDGLYLYTTGMRKFNLPELELPNLTPDDEILGQTLMLSACQNTLLGKILEPGDRIGSVKMPFEAREGGFDKAMWEGIPVFELLPPTRHTAGEALRAFEGEI